MFMFETFNVPGLYVAVQPVLVLALDTPLPRIKNGALSHYPMVICQEKLESPLSFDLKTSPYLHAVPVQMTVLIGKAMKWWEKGIQPNMKEINSAQELVDSLLKSGDKLVIVDFFSPGCAGCKALHPKICQFAERNPDVLFLQVNYEMHKSMCYSLNVHVLPFFRFYRGANGRLCSFSCTNATIKKFKDALAKHNTERCSLGPAKGLEESELLALAANKDLCFNYTKKEEPVFTAPEVKESVSAIKELPLSLVSKDKALAASGR